MMASLGTRFAAVLTALVASGLGLSRLDAQQFMTPSGNGATVMAAADLAAAIRDSAQVLPGEFLLARSSARRDGAVASLIVERTGLANEVGDPEWPIQARLVMDSKRPGESFVAAMYGRANDEGALHLTGIITVGSRAGSEVHLDSSFGAFSAATITVLPLHSR